MMHGLEVLRGRQTSAPALVKLAVRFSRRLRERGIHYADFPSIIDDGRSCCKVTIGQRQINIFNDGSFTRSLLRKDGHADGRAFVAQSHRMHAIYLDMAADTRRYGTLAYARSQVQLATEERLHHERPRYI